MKKLLPLLALPLLIAASPTDYAAPAKPSKELARKLIYNYTLSDNQCDGAYKIEEFKLNSVDRYDPSEKAWIVTYEYRSSCKEKKSVGKIMATVNTNYSSIGRPTNGWLRHLGDGKYEAFTPDRFKKIR